MSMLKKLGLGAVLAATTLSAAAPADAQYYRGYHGYRGGGIGAGGAALLGGIVGLGVGATIADSANRRYYDRGYYYDAPPPRVIYRERYYAPPPPVIVRERVYDGGYYGGGYYGRGYYGY